MTRLNTSDTNMINSKKTNNFKGKFKKLSILAVFSVFSFSAWAMPTIESVEGRLHANSEIKIVGEGFSERSAMFDFRDSANGYAVKMKDKDIVTGKSEDAWLRKGSTWGVPLTTTLVEEDDNMRYVYQGVGKTYNGYFKPLDKETNHTLYVSWMYKPSERPTHSGGSNKFIRIWDAHSGEETRISWTIMHMTYSGMPKASWEGFSGQAGEWNKMEFWVDAPNNHIQAKINGNIVHDVHNFVKRENGIGLKVALLGFDPSDGGNYLDMVTQIDDIYTSTTRARVMISKEPTWEKALIQGVPLIPTSWTDTEIVLDLNVEPLNLTKMTYLYVVDNEGNANEEGYELCTYCPLAPEVQSN